MISARTLAGREIRCKDNHKLYHIVVQDRKNEKKCAQWSGTSEILELQLQLQGGLFNRHYSAEFLPWHGFLVLL